MESCLEDCISINKMFSVHLFQLPLGSLGAAGYLLMVPDVEIVLVHLSVLCYSPDRRKDN